MKFYKNILKKTEERISPNIDYKKKILFVHIPKNAGTAIVKNVGLNESNHRTVKEYINLLGQDKYEEMFSFAFVRNPFSRFLSLYNYAKMEISHYHNNIEPDKAIYGEHLDYKQLKNLCLEDAAILLKEGKLLHNPPHVQWNSQLFWLLDNESNINIKYLGRFEDLDFNMRNIYRSIGSFSNIKLRKVNSSSDGIQDYRKLINSNTRDILEEIYKEDLDTFNYDF